ncbi:MAG TPA: polyprenyl synthetase family protein, partial [Novosphingobium sp.]|nr:polyprenyl synthetase family protein [Novosphingobium sp.]
MAGKAADPLLADALVRIAADVDSLFDALLPVPQDTSARLIEAMRYATIGGGKRLRPLLLTATAAMYGVDRAPALRAAIAVEAIHAYSLIHDDLPCMDDDDLRHGKPTTHLAFDEATAILAGDALQCLA